MKVILIALLFVALGRTQDVDDQAAIARTIAGLNRVPYPSGTFVDGADTSLPDKLESAAGGVKVVISHEPWGEARFDLGQTRITSTVAQFITPEVALVDGAFTATGVDGVPRNTPVLFVMKKEASGWRIALIRLAGNLPAKN